MERLMNIVEEERRAFEKKLSQMAEDYISKACKALKEYFEEYSLDSWFLIRFAVEITDINYSEGTVEVGDVWAENDYDYDNNSYLFDSLVPAEEMKDRYADVLKSKIESYMVEPFIEELYTYGFTDIRWNNEFSVLLPFVKVQ